VGKKPYKIFTDRFNYQLLEKNNDNITDSIAVLRQMQIEALILTGGEPLVNKNLYTVLDAVNCNHLTVTTNLSSGKEQLDTFLDSCKKFKQVDIYISIDATGKMAEFNRHGLNFDFFNSNLQYLTDNKPDNVQIKILSLMTSITIRDIKNFSQYINDMLAAGKVSSWNLSTCQSPKIQSLVTLPDEYKVDILKTLKEFEPNGIVTGLDSLITELTNSKFNNTMHQELRVFLSEFKERKRIDPLECLE
jgi:organic radical activating enzyme